MLLANARRLSIRPFVDSPLTGARLRKAKGPDPAASPRTRITRSRATFGLCWVLELRENQHCPARGRGTHPAGSSGSWVGHSSRELHSRAFVRPGAGTLCPAPGDTPLPGGHRSAAAKGGKHLPASQATISSSVTVAAFPRFPLPNATLRLPLQSSCSAKGLRQLFPLGCGTQTYSPGGRSGHRWRIGTGIAINFLR